jgi:phosphoribosylaminoimidazolecarboxamide formyltransferase / IMP cyclohydrolase
MTTAFISVSCKDNVVPLIQTLHSNGWYVIATDDTQKYVNIEACIRTISVESVTGSPPMFDGRVKIFHPKIFGGVLAKCAQKEEAEKYNIQLIDLVAINFYPFLNAVASWESDEDRILDCIDTGGPALVREAIKNRKRVTVLTDPDDYKKVIREIETYGNTLSKTRDELALKAYEHVMQYDAAVYNWMKSKIKKIQHPEDPNRDLYAGGMLDRTKRK